MSFEEKNAWAYLAIAVAGYAAYLAIMLGRLQGAKITAVPYADAMLWAIGGAIVASIVLTIVLSIFFPRDAGKKDQRDKDVDRQGQYVGGLVLGVAVIIPFLLTLLELDHFWIANATYAAFVLSATVGTTVKLVAYRRGL
jgi:hypothetical protein